jgi:hypothetical protein
LLIHNVPLDLEPMLKKIEKTFESLVFLHCASLNMPGKEIGKKDYTLVTPEEKQCSYEFLKWGEK